MDGEVRQCAGFLCPMQADTINVGGCNLYERCHNYFPKCENAAELMEELMKPRYMEPYQKYNILYDFVWRRGRAEKAGHDVGWISVKDKLPEMCSWVLVSCIDIEGEPPFITVAYRHKIKDDEDWWWWLWYASGVKTQDRVTHWMPLPEPPEEG